MHRANIIVINVFICRHLLIIVFLNC